VSLHETYRDDAPPEAGSNRAFGCTVGGIAMALGVVKAVLAAAVTWFPLAIFLAGAMLLLLGLVAPAHLSVPHRLWLRLGTALARVVNPVVLALLFLLVITPLALVMRLVGKRPLRLKPDPRVATYWIDREPAAGAASDMRRQF